MGIMTVGNMTWRLCMYIFKVYGKTSSWYTLDFLQGGRDSSPNHPSSEEVHKTRITFSQVSDH